MITAHLPAGYILARSLKQAPWVLTAALAGSILPDFDLLWFYFIDDRAIHHHRYWVHAPGFWAMVAGPALALTWYGAPRLIRAVGAFFLALTLHIILDTIAGGIMWQWPFNTRLISWITVPATHNHFILSFLTHWTFLLELCVWIVAGFLWRKRASQKTHLAE